MLWDAASQGISTERYDNKKHAFSSIRFELETRNPLDVVQLQLAIKIELYVTPGKACSNGRPII